MKKIKGGPRSAPRSRSEKSTFSKTAKPVRVGFKKDDSRSGEKPRGAKDPRETFKKVPVIYDRYGDERKRRAARPAAEKPAFKKAQEEDIFDDESGHYIFGRKTILEAFSSDKSVEKIFAAYGASGTAVEHVRKAAREAGVPFATMAKDKFAALERRAGGHGETTQGMIALMSPVETLDIRELIKIAFKETKNPVLVALDGVTDPHNLGAIARSVECSGAQGLILPLHNSSPVTPVAVKTSAGALEHLPIAKVGNLVQTIEILKEAGFWIAGTAGEAETNYDAPVYDRPMVIITGSEGEGMRPSTRKHCDMLLKIPLSGKVSSLNASVATAVILFEIARQKRVGEFEESI
jgi:23S rRNA (guanosine2251-2'-O)-methyltransferase